MFENFIKLEEQKRSKMSLTKKRLKLKKLQILHSQACISDTLEAIYKICAPYAANMIKQELVLSVEKILLVNNNTVTDPNGKCYNIHSNSCTCFISQCQKLVCRHLFSFRRENGLNLFTASDVPQHHKLATYMSAEDGIDNRPLMLSTVPVQRRVLSKNEIFRKAKDTLGDNH